MSAACACAFSKKKTPPYRVKLGKDIVRLHFGAFAVLGVIDLVGGVVFFGRWSNFELARTLRKDIHFFLGFYDL